MTGENRTQLSQASFEGNLATVNHLLASDVEYLEVDASGRTALHWAISGHHLKVVETLLAHHQRKISSSPPKPIEIHTLKYNELKRLALSVRPVVTPIELAAQVDDQAIFKLLLEHLEAFADTIVRLNGVWPPVPCAAVPCTCDQDVNDSDLAKNTSVPHRQENQNDVDKQKELLVFILHLAIKDDKFPVAEMALRLGADAEASYGRHGFLPLHVAALCRQDPAYIHLLVSFGANPDAKAIACESTSLSLAIAANNERAVTALLGAGASPEGMLGDACSLYLRDPSSSVALSIIRALLHAGADISRWTMLVAAENGAPLFKELVAWGGDVTTTYYRGRCIAHDLAERSLWGTEQEYEAILEIFRRAYGSPDNLREALLAPEVKNIRYSVLLDFGFHADHPMPFYTFVRVIFGRIRDLMPGRLEVLIESSHVVPEPLPEDSSREDFTETIFEEHFNMESDISPEKAEKIVSILRILDQAGLIRPEEATNLLFDIITKSTRPLGSGIEHVVDALLDLGDPTFNESWWSLHDLFALAAIHHQERILSCFLRRVDSQGGGKEESRLICVPCPEANGVDATHLFDGNGLCGMVLDSLHPQLEWGRRPPNWARHEVFMDVIYKGNMEAVKWFISVGAHLNQPDKRYEQGQDVILDWTGLHAAIFLGNGPMVDLLLQANARVNVASREDFRGFEVYTSRLEPVHGLRPLHVAVVLGNLGIVERLLAHGADPNGTIRRRKDEIEKTVLEFALTNGEWLRCPISIIALLVKQGAKVSGLAPKLSELYHGLDGILEQFAEYQGVWDILVAGQ